MTKTIRKTYQESEDFYCPYCGGNLGDDFKRKLIDKLKLEDDLQLTDCPLCKNPFWAELETCFQLRTRYEE